MTGRGALAVRRARRHLGRVPRRVEREARERSTGGVVRSGAQVLLRDRDASARGHQLGTERPFIGGPRRASKSSCRSPRPRPRAPHPSARAPAGVPGDGERPVAEASADARGVLKVRPTSPTPPLAHAAPRQVGKRKEREAERSTHGLEPSVDDPSHLKRTKRSPFSVLCTSFSAPRSSTRRSREATWAPRDRSPRTSTSRDPADTNAALLIVVPASAFQTRGPARRFFST